MFFRNAVNLSSRLYVPATPAGAGKAGVVLAINDVDTDIE
jgi:hypothetical protein